MVEPRLAYGMLGAASDDPFDRAALRQRESVKPSRGRAYTPETEALLQSIVPTSPADIGLTLALGPAGRVVGPAGRIGAAALGMMMEPDTAEAGKTGAVRKLAAGVVPKVKEAASNIGGIIHRGLEFTREGVPTAESSAYGKASGETLEAIKGMPKGAGPLDLSGNLRSDVPQRAIPRYEPARGISPRMQAALDNPAVVEGVRQSMIRGVEMGADKWYLNEPLRQAWIKELGPQEGAQEFSRFMDYVAATSPRSDVPTNIRNASYYYALGGQGGGQPPLTYPYGHLAQDLHRSNIAQLQAAYGSNPDWGGWDIYKNPKPVSFSQDLQGNLIPVAGDTHAMRNITMRTEDPRFLETQIQEVIKAGKPPSEFQREYGEIKRSGDKTVAVYRPQQLVESGRMTMPQALEVPPFWVAKPRENEYGAVEQLYGDIARPMGLAPGEGQSAAWSGAGELTGLGTNPNLTFPQMFNNRVLYTAMMRREHPDETLRDLIRKNKPLLGIGGAGMAGPMLARAGISEEQLPQQQ